MAFTTIIGRFDPFRVLVIREMQLRPEYSHDQKNFVSIQWRGDVHAEGAVKELWRSDRHVSEMTRALLGDYYDQLFWRPAFQRVIDDVGSERGGDWMRDLRRLMPSGFLPYIRQRSAAVYSSCSKGVHHEFVIPPSSYYDTATLNAMLDDAVEVIAALGLTANLSSDAMFPLSLDDAIACFERLQMDSDATTA